MSEVVSGLESAVNGQSAVKEWKIRYQKPGAPMVHSKTGGAVARACGVGDWRGFFHGYGYLPVVLPGDTFTFTARQDDSAAAANTGDGVSGPAIADSATIIWDIERAKTIEYRVDFSGNGAFSLDQDFLAVDDQAVVHQCTEGLTVTIGGTHTSQLRNLQLILRRKNRAFNHSGTAGWVNRTIGTLDAEFRLRRYLDSSEPFPVLATPLVYRFNVTSTLYYQLTYCQSELIDDYGAETEGDEDADAALRGVFNAYVGTTQGSILLPLGTPPTLTEWWPSDDR